MVHINHKNVFWILCLTFNLPSLQAYKKMNKDLKKEQIEILKTKYGIDLEKDK